MEKLSKLTTEVFSLRDINFSGFSTSENWVGYIEKKEVFSFDLIDEAVDLFTGFFEKSQDTSTIITALSFDDNREDDVEIIDKYQDVYNEVKSNGLLKPMTDEYESYLYGDSFLPASSLSISFDKNDFINISKLMMCHAGVIGQVFFYVNLSQNIAIYPHDDVGFGCIALNAQKNGCLDFLRYCSKNEKFNVFISE